MKKLRRIIAALALMVTLSTAGLVAQESPASAYVKMSDPYFIDFYHGAAVSPPGYAPYWPATWVRVVVRCSNTGSVNHYGASVGQPGYISQYICSNGGLVTQTWEQIG